MWRRSWHSHRRKLEARAGGNPSFNFGVNYTRQLSRSVDYAEVQALYAAAGLSLDADLATLQKAPRIMADQRALTYLSNNIIYNGQLTIPVMTLHTTGDGAVPVAAERAYKTIVHKANNGALLHDTFMHRAGHCEFSPAEMITAVQTLDLRVTTGKWKDLTTTDLNNEAAALGPAFNFIYANDAMVPAVPAFLNYQPLQFLRIYDAFTQ